jgi:hypothetical protein
VTYPRVLDAFRRQRLEAIFVRQRADESRIVAAARVLDSQLARDPLDVGESRYDTVRIGFELPLGIQFEVLQDVRTVIDYDVWWIDRNLK